MLAPSTHITIASPAGGEAPLDPSSIDKSDKVSANFLDTKEALWKNTEKLSSFVGRAKEFDAIFYVGGHGREFTSIARPAATCKVFLELSELRLTQSPQQCLT